MRSFLACLAAAVLSTTASPASAAAGPGFAALANAFIGQRSAEGVFSGSVLIAYDGRIILRKAYGLANRELNTPAHPDSEYEIGSTTKTFTAAAIAQLIAAGKLSLDDRLSRFVPDPPPAWKDITIAQLLSHESGLPEYSATTNSFRSLMRIPRTPAEVLDLVRTLPLKFVPGSHYGYTNTDYVALGLILEQASGEPYETYVQRHLLAPVGLAHTGFWHAQDLIRNRASAMAAACPVSRATSSASRDSR